MGDNGMEGCKFLHTSTAVYTEGIMQSLILSGNFSDSDENAFLADVIHFKNSDNSRNKADDHSQKIKI